MLEHQCFASTKNTLWDGCDFSSCVNRMQKIATIAYQAPNLLEHLRACWENRKGSYNCGECGKCIGTIVALELCNSRSLTKTFPNVSTGTLLLNLKLPLNHNHLFHFWEDMLDYAKEQANPGLQQAIANMLTRNKRRRNLRQVLKTFSRAAPKSLRARVSKALYN